MNDAERREVIKGRLAGSELTKSASTKSGYPASDREGPTAFSAGRGPGKCYFCRDEIAPGEADRNS